MRRAPLLAALAALACAPRAAVAPPRPALDPRLAAYPAPIRAAVAAGRVVPGMDAAAVRLAWGEPSSVERIPSAISPGLVYERWRYGAPGREVTFADGKVLGAADATGR